MSINPRETPEGAIRYNTDSNKMEVWIGDKWKIVSTGSPNLDGGARGVFFGGAPSNNALVLLAPVAIPQRASVRLPKSIAFPALSMLK